MSEDGGLARGREAARRFAWSDAHAALALADQSSPLAAEDLELLATAAYLLGRVDDFRDALRRAHLSYLTSGETRRAARCVFWLGFTLLLEGDIGQAGGWLARANRLVGSQRQECAEHGLLLLPAVLQALVAGDFATAQATAARAVEIGGRVGDPDLLALALHFQGRALVSEGRLGEGLASLDEAMVAVVADEVSPPVAGNIYCSMIDACMEISELRRAREWTTALTAWCGRQPDMVTFTGQCLVHRAEIMQLHGDWPEAVEEAKRAVERFADAADRYASGAAFYREAEVYRARGDFPAAEDAYRRASEWGHQPQPGHALLRLDEGKAEVAARAIGRVVAETTDRLRRAKLLPALVEITLAVGDIQAAREAAVELSVTAKIYDTPALRADTGNAWGAIFIAEGDPAGALVRLRDAWRLWQELDAPYEAARTRVLIALACRAVGDEDGAAMELEAARGVFARLGAAPDLARTEKLAHSWADVAVHGLTPRELEVLRLLATGKTNQAIAADLVLAEKTVHRHVSNIFAKLGVSSRTAATAYAFQHRLVS